MATDQMTADLIRENAQLKAALAQYRQDLKDAAGKLAVPMPEPGTDMAKLLRANVLLRQREARRWELLREAVQCFCVTQKPADYPVDSWINKALTELRRPEEAGT